jgi:hypothetical protein
MLPDGFYLVSFFASYSFIGNFSLILACHVYWKVVYVSTIFRYHFCHASNIYLVHYVVIRIMFFNSNIIIYDH